MNFPVCVLLQQVHVNRECSGFSGEECMIIVIDVLIDSMSYKQKKELQQKKLASRWVIQAFNII